MPAGLEIYDQNGKLQITDNFLSYTLRVSGTTYVTDNKVGNTARGFSIPGSQSYSTTLIAIQGPELAAYAGYNGTGWTGPAGQLVFATLAPVGTAYNYFIFQQSSFIPSTNFGLEVRDASGQITFSSNYRTMRVIDTILYSDNESSINSLTLSYPGRSVAVIPSTFAGHRINGQLEYFQGGVPVLPPGQGGDPDVGQYQYGWQNYGDLYGISSRGGNYSTVQTGLVGWDRVFIGPQFGSQQPDEWDNPLNAFVVDVTGIPIGVQFF